MRKNTADQQNYHKPKKELRSVRSLLACLQDGSAPAWLAGEHYLLCGMCRAVMNALVHSPALPYVSNTKKQSVPYAFTVSETVVPRANTVEMITALSHFHPDEAFLRSFPMMRTAAVLCRIAQHRTNTDAPREFGAWLDQLRYGKEIDEKYPNIKYTVPYVDSVYAIVTLDETGARVQGTKSEFVGISPEEQGVYKGGGYFIYINSGEWNVVYNHTEYKG